jgi:hypothetical protein
VYKIRVLTWRNKNHPKLTSAMGSASGYTGSDPRERLRRQLQHQVRMSAQTGRSPDGARSSGTKLASARASKATLLKAKVKAVMAGHSHRRHTQRIVNASSGFQEIKPDEPSSDEFADSDDDQ